MLFMKLELNPEWTKLILAQTPIITVLCRVIHDLAVNHFSIIGNDAYTCPGCTFKSCLYYVTP